MGGMSLRKLSQVFRHSVNAVILITFSRKRCWYYDTLR